MIIGKLDADGWKIKEVDIPEREPIFLRSMLKRSKGYECEHLPKTVLRWRELEKWESE